MFRFTRKLSAEGKLSRLKQPRISIAQCKAGVKAYFNHELCEAFFTANIPLSRLNNPTLKKRSWSSTRPTEFQMRIHFVKLMCQKFVVKLLMKFEKNLVTIFVDVTTDTRGSYIVHLLLEILTADCAGDPYLIASKKIEKENGSMVCTFINDFLVQF